ncbi:hypothetical protein KO495_13660 [Colwellia sp. D2M02]|uniref:hypothetical protein n=1 Tax=Colwellia sp. D2M02 TaxID=2841562 RepID=UPI001C08EE54|nr:hypothetical protein [Colwellia sp. D2M02]MBU2894356.1 hypothetical protein [Colwellia sp. D2M02]
MKYKLIVNLIIMCFCALPIAVNAESPNKEELLSRWEQLQKTSSELKSFNKVDEDTYSVSFNNIPFEGDIDLININIEEITYETTLPISYMGIIEIKLPKALKELEESYGHSFYRWQEGTYFYYNHKTNTWLTGKEYSKLSSNIYQTLEPTKLTKLMEQYAGELVVGLVLLFIMMMLIQLTFLWRIKAKLNKVKEH